MKRLLFFLAALMLVSAGFGQISTSKDTVLMELRANDDNLFNKGLVPILNGSMNAVRVEWEVVTEDLTAVYDSVVMCDCGTCFPANAFPMLDSCEIGGSGLVTFSLQIRTSDTVHEGAMVMRVTNKGDAGNVINFVYWVREYVVGVGEDQAQNPSVRMYPNPSTSGVYLIGLSEVDAVVSDISGKIVHRERFDAQSDKYMDLQHLPPGIYTVSMDSDKGLFSDKLVIQ